MSGWNIYRMDAGRKIYGRAIPGFIRNFDHYLTAIETFADGAINCWGFVDRELFASKIEKRWVATAPPVGAQIGIHNLGMVNVAEAEWTLSPVDMIRVTDDAIHELNPDMTGLIDMEGDDCELRGKMRYAKMPLVNGEIYRIGSNGTEIVGTALPVFLRRTNDFVLTHWFIYSDATSQVGYNGSLMPLSDTIKSMSNSSVTTDVPDGAWITIEGLGKFKTASGHWGINPRERIREAHDELSILQGQPGAVRQCIAAHKAYIQEPSESAREVLRTAYRAVPSHLRRYCGDMDSKDWPIRRILATKK